MIKLGIDVDGVDSDGYELHWAKERDLEPLAEWIEEGGDLGPETRKWLAAYLRGKIKWKRGNKRTRPQIEMEERIVGAIREFQHQGKFWLAFNKMSPDEKRRLLRNKSEQEAFLNTNRGSITKNAAVELFLKFARKAPPKETVRTYLRKYKLSHAHSRW